MDAHPGTSGRVRTRAQLAFGTAVGAALSGAAFVAIGVPVSQALASLAVVAAVMLAVGIIAALGPARRGLRVDASEALRADAQEAAVCRGYNRCVTQPEIRIANRRVGPAHAPLVIAEIGINHEGSLETARQMVDAAARAGVEVIKHQTHVVDDEMSGAAKRVIPGNADVSIYEIMHRCALSEDDERRLQDYVMSKGMIFISTPFSRAAADRLAAMDVPAFKIGSGECNNYPLLRHIAAFGKPVILSTGMNTVDSVRKAVAVFDEARVAVALLHTTNLYPTPPHLVRLGAMTELAAAFPDKVVGLSDHTTNNLACIAAVALGASILERHFTDHMQRPGPDIVCSMDEQACRELIEAARIVKLERGGRKEPAAEEKVTIDFAFATVVTIAPVRRGEVFSRENLWVKRPGTGAIAAEHYEGLLGRAATRDIPPDTHISLEDVS